MAGGPAGALERVRPVLDVIAKAVFHLGPVGAGATMKLVVNGVVHALNQRSRGAGAGRARRGRPAGRLRGVRGERDRRAVRALQARLVEDPAGSPVAFRLDLVAKDLALLDALAATAGARMDQAATNRRRRRGAGRRLRRPRHQRDRRIPPQRLTCGSRQTDPLAKQYKARLTGHPRIDRGRFSSCDPMPLSEAVMRRQPSTATAPPKHP